jgi:pimeloyl-ACP methyl ester carboxylesterase
MFISFAHANGMPAPTYQVLFEQLNNPVIAKHQYAHDPHYPLVNGWARQVDELLDYLDEHGHQRDVVAVGHSFGAIISYLAVCREPQRFRALIMLDPPLLTGFYGWLFERVKRSPLINQITPAGLSSRRTRHWSLDTDLPAYFARKAFFRNFHSQAIADYAHSVVREKGQHLTLSYDPEIEAQIFRTIPTTLARHYGQCQVTSLLVTGTHTDVTMPWLRRAFISRQPEFRHTEVEGGHMFVLESPAQTAQVINDFVTLL